MPVLSWETPEKVRSSEEHANTFVADGAPPGTYVSNMSAEDASKWKAKLVGQKTGFPQVEIRKDGFVIVVSLRGYKYKHYNTRRTEENLRKWQRYGWGESQAAVVHLACSGPVMFLKGEFDEFKQAVQEAEMFLLNLEKKSE